MSFADLYVAFVSGTPIKRKPWGGYWKYSRKEILMHCKDGAVLNIKESEDILFTLSGILQDDWEIATAENCTIPIV